MRRAGIHALFSLAVLYLITSTFFYKSACGLQFATPPAECAHFERIRLFEQIDHGLSRYVNLTSWQRLHYDGFCSKRQRACVALRTKDGIPYVVDLHPGYQSRVRATLHAVQRALNHFGRLPKDFEIVIDVSDGELQNVDLPVLVITHRKDQPFGLLYPDFTFFSWPESACPPNEPSHAYGPLVEAFLMNWTQESTPWSSRTDRVFWRGAHVLDGGMREVAVRHLEAVPGADVSFITWRAVSVTGENHVSGCVGLLEQCQFQYLAFLAGSTYSSRLKFQLFCGSVVLAAEPVFAEWWTALVVPGVHYARVAHDWNDVGIVIAALRKAKQEANRIARNGQELAFSALTPLAVDCYWWTLLASFARHMPAPQQALPAHARPLEDALLWPDDVVLSAGAGGPVGGPLFWVT